MFLIVNFVFVFAKGPVVCPIVVGLPKMCAMFCSVLRNYGVGILAFCIYLFCSVLLTRLSAVILVSCQLLMHRKILIFETHRAVGLAFFFLFFFS